MIQEVFKIHDFAKTNSKQDLLGFFLSLINLYGFKSNYKMTFSF